MIIVKTKLSGLSQNRLAQFQKIFLFWDRINSKHTWNASKVTFGLLAILVCILKFEFKTISIVST